jgi:hypothetical protein
VHSLTLVSTRLITSERSPLTYEENEKGDVVSILNAQLEVY